MPHSPAEVLRAALVAAGVGSLPSDDAAWPIYVGHMPDTPDSAICVYDTSGRSEGRIMSTGETIIKPGFQIRTRAKAHTDGYVKAHAAGVACDGFRNTDIALGGGAGYRLISVSRIGGIASLGVEPEGNRRVGFTLNGTLTYREV